MSVNCKGYVNVNEYSCRSKLYCIDERDGNLPSCSVSLHTAIHHYQISSRIFLGKGLVRVGILGELRFEVPKKFLIIPIPETSGAWNMIIFPSLTDKQPTSQIVFHTLRVCRLIK